MDRWLLGFIVGAILSLLPPHVPALFYECLLIFVITIGVLIKRWRLLACICCGALWVLNHGSAYNSIWRDNEIYGEQFFRQQHSALIEVVDIPVTTETGVRFIGLVTKLEQRFLARPINVRLNLSHRYLKQPILSTDGKNSRASPLTGLRQGDLLTANIKFKPAHGLGNQGGFNYQRWLRTKGIHATGYIVLPSVKYDSLGQSMREQLYLRIKTLTEAFSQQALILALLFGERSLFDKQIWAVLQATGTQHLVAISGLHVGLVVAIAYFFARAILRLAPLRLLSVSTKLMLSKRNTQFSILAFSTVAAVFYSYLAGFAIPTVRALIFFLLLAASQLLPLRLSPTRLILLSAVVTIILIPSSVYTTSFWLSYCAVAAIMLVYWRFGFWLAKVPQKFPSIFKKAMGFMLIQVGIVILLMPVTAISFGQLSTISVLANSVALPVVGLVVMPLLFVAFLLLMIGEPLFKIVATSANEVLNWLWLFLQWLSQMPNAIFSLSNEQVLSLGLLVLTLMLLMMFVPKPWPQKVAGKVTKQRNKGLLSRGVAITAVVVPVVVPVVYWPSTDHFSGENQEWQVTVLDVGQGLAVVIRRGGKAILYDTGNAYPSGWNLAEQAVLPYLKHQGVTLDYLIISHDDSDHAAGASQVLNAYPEAKLVFNGQLKNLSAEYKIVSQQVIGQKTNGQQINSQQIVCQQGQNIMWQGLTLAMLWPKKIVAEHNDDSCVIRISDGENALLLTGDITKKVERQLIKYASSKGLTADIVIAPHHGSKSSSTKDFIKHLKASAVVFSAGYLNQWKMPNQQVVARYQNANVQVFSTADDGMVQFTMSANRGKDAKAWQVSTYRADISPYWFNN